MKMASGTGTPPASRCETFILTAPEGITPKHVRYAYAGKPAVNLINEVGLPAHPFKTD